MATPALVDRKVCTRCHIEKSIAAFSARKISKDGYRNMCRDCCNAARRTDEHRQVKNKRRRERYAADPEYKKKSREHQKTDKYKAWAKEYNAIYYSNNKSALDEASRERAKKHYLDNTSRYKEKHKAWRASNRDKVRYYTAKYRAKKLQATATWDQELTVLCNQEAHAHAVFLEELTGVKHEVDHIIPLQGKNVSGLHVWNNLQVITLTDNRKKSSNLLKGL